MPRTPKLTAETQALVLQAIRTGNTKRTAAGYAGVDERTLYQWLAKGAAARAPALYRQFRQALEKAEADATVTSVNLVRNAATESWQAAAWWLERRWPDEWGRKDRVELTEIIRREAEKLAEETGLNVYDIIKESEAIIGAR